ncbi:MAG: AbrB/MazE/SpoVT family DNA-binding domain-containing protein [Candidatus Gracilibacteria bacterium]|nr:AbrB/MazE/SpoVT family DNA-binding domain-containing protein [Candidatus Gracilibacteria bacterium]MDD3120664.1 AbrB/MazE/SpoVT family DNA-binding domain-containing protein [Candidatus Gracilibacteria bacterium]
MIDLKECEAIHKEGGLKLHSTVTVGTKGQVVIPAEVRELLNLKSGDTLMVITKYGKAIGMIKTDDIDVMMEYMKKEMENMKNAINSKQK